MNSPSTPVAAPTGKARVKPTTKMEDFISAAKCETMLEALAGYVKSKRSPLTGNLRMGRGAKKDATN